MRAETNGSPTFEQVLDLARAQVGRSAAHPVEVVVVALEARFCRPQPAEAGVPEGHELGLGEGDRRVEPGGQGDRALLAARRVLAGGVGGELERRVRPDPLDGRAGELAPLEELVQHGARLAEAAGVLPERFEVPLGGREGRLPVLEAREDALESQVRDSSTSSRPGRTLVTLAIVLPDGSVVPQGV